VLKVEKEGKRVVSKREEKVNNESGVWVNVCRFMHT